MCGVVGIYHGDERPGCEDTIRAMISTLRHRGPDDDGIFVAPGIGLGHARLAIRDLSRDGRQPFSDPSGRIVVSYNGEIYNHEGLRNELEREFGFVFRTVCDTEVIPLGYLAWGDRLFERLEGMYAIALWDAHERRLLLVRDGIGIKPLFYSENAGTVRFASEIKGLLADPEQPARLSAQGLHAFFAMGYVGPFDTTLSDVWQVPPGTILSYHRGKRSLRQFWRPTRKPEIFDIEDATAELAALWPKVVQSQLASDVPVGVLLSGGIDSSLVALAANRPDHRLPAFTASFANEAFDETPIARQVVQRVGADLHTVSVELHSEMDVLLRDVVRHYDGQSCDEASLALFMLCSKVRQQVTVALTGDGGDEFFAGYPTYAASRWASRIGSLLPAAVWSGVGRLLHGATGAKEQRLPPRAVASRFALGVASGPGTAHIYWRRYIPQFMLPDLYGPELRPLIGEDPFAGYKAELQNADGELIDRCLLADQRWHLPGGLLLKSDAMSMAHALELRVPLLDRRIMDFAGRCHSDLLLSPRGEKKALLRSLARNLEAPTDVTDGAKRGFNAPLAGLLRRQLRNTAERIFERDADLFEPYISPGAVRGLWKDHGEGRLDHAYVLWPLLHFALSRTVPRPVSSVELGAHATQRVGA
ncbi:hypothetical protein A1D31_34005 [Bradyrhizobium liaoningense]|nr:hypothetical protein A1D31_34005 [Bradyrhizobium liaoningense]